MSTELSGTGLVADDLYLMAHHEVNGKPFVQPRVLGTGLAGGLLAELMLLGGIVLQEDGAVGPGRIVPRNGMAYQVLNQIAAEQEAHPVQEWLLFLARTATEDVVRRLERSGYVTRAAGRGRWRPGRWVPVDADWAFSPLLRVRSALDAARPLDAREAVLAGLADACGLGFRLEQYLPPPGRSLEEALGQLDPGLRELITQTQAAIGSAVLAHRA
jgi:hypothetical protein